MAVPLVFAAAAALALTEAPPAAQARQNNPDEVSFDTADGVRLKGLFHKSATGDKQGNAVVVLLYSPGPDRTMLKPGDWPGLTKTLNDAGFHVFRFDWRGHGKSTDITDTDLFWRNGITGGWNNRYIRGANKKPVKSSLDVKADLGDRSPYFPCYVNDLAAARVYLDQKNDEGGLNSSSIYLIGAGDTATLGMLWLTAEWFRPAVHPTLGGGVQFKVVPTPGIVADPEAGRDIAGAVWLSAARPPMVRDTTVQNLPKISMKMRDVNPMLFLYGEKDTAAASQSKFFFDNVLVAKGNRAIGVKELEQTFLTAVPKTSLNGVNLLGKNGELGTEDTILKYLAARQKDRVAKTVKKRMYVSPYFIDLRYFGL
jgi:hypothetical protein